MKSKILVLFTALLLSGIFSACNEEEINPNDGLNTRETVGNGVVKDDPGF
ncbi:MAG TPA: hypothetical protein PKL31_12855 [Fulvivirga sp.]|nr:hypothetical protein [Fulvivirga sp.]HNP19320.1 hypothetical protein [Fulvivirga sp.]